MQWSDGDGCGFTSARPRVPVVTGGEFGCGRVSVGGQRRDPGSLLNWMERLVRTRKETPELGWGAFQVLPAGDPAVLALRHDWRGSVVLTVHNLADRPAEARLEPAGGDPGAGPVELLADQAYEPLELPSGVVPVGAYGYRWFRLRG